MYILIGKLSTIPGRNDVPIVSVTNRRLRVFETLFHFKLHAIYQNDAAIRGKLSGDSLLFAG